MTSITVQDRILRRVWPFLNEAVRQQPEGDIKLLTAAMFDHGLLVNPKLEDGITWVYVLIGGVDVVKVDGRHVGVAVDSGQLEYTPDPLLDDDLST